MIKSEFDALTAAQQWLWLIKNPDKVEMVTLDNDSTSIRFKGTEDEDDRYSHFHDDIGNRAGVDHILTALGIPNEHC